MSTLSASKCLKLYNAVELGNTADAERLLSDPETSPGYQIRGDLTPFTLAFYHDKVDIVRLFLACKKPFDYNHRAHNRLSVLQYAASWHREETLRLLVDDSRFDVNILTREKSLTALNLAIGSPQCVKIILASERFTQVNTPDEDGETVLQRAIRFDQREIVDIIKAYMEDPVTTRARLREELGGYPEYNAGELFAIIVLLCGGYFSLA